MITACHPWLENFSLVDTRKDREWFGSILEENFYLDIFSSSSFMESNQRVMNNVFFLYDVKTCCQLFFINNIPSEMPLNHGIS